MKLVKCKQGSDTWLKARLGIPTGSEFGAIVTPGGKAVTGSKRQSYLAKLAAERIMGEVEDSYVSPAMERGTLLEPNARAWYEIDAGVDVKVVGFAVRDDGRAGASPDGLVGTDGGIEIKCPGPKNFIAAALGEISDYLLQCHAGMWVCERDWWDLVFFSDRQRLPGFRTRIHRSDAICAVFEEAVPRFCDDLDEMTDKLKAMGMGVEAADARTEQWLEDFANGKFTTAKETKQKGTT